MSTARIMFFLLLFCIKKVYIISMESKETNIIKTVNQLLLTNLLKFASLSQSACSKTLSHHRNSLVGYVYRYGKKIFPRSFSYFFLLSLYRALAKKYDPRKDIKRIDLFNQMIKSHGGAIEKLLIPALEHHILAVSSLNPGINIGTGENITVNKNDIFDQDEETILNKYIEKIEPEKYEDYVIFLDGYENTEDWLQNVIGKDFEAIGEIEEFYTDHFKNFESEIKAIKDFYIICENLRKIYLPNFYSPSEYKKIDFVNNKDSGFLMKKSAIRKRLEDNDFSKLFFFTANDDYMSPTISMGDDCLAVKISFNNKEDLKKMLKGGLFVVRELKGICIRRLQFSEFKDTFQIISIPDNKEYSRQTFPALDNDGNPRVLGKIIWRSGFTISKEVSEDFEIPEFLRKSSNPNLFSEQLYEEKNDLNDADIKHINRILSKKDLKLFEIDELVNKYRRSNYLKKEINNHPKIKKIFPEGLFVEENDILIKKRA